MANSRFDEGTVRWFKKMAFCIVFAILFVLGARMVYLNDAMRADRTGGNRVEHHEIRKCGCDWAYCDGECKNCTKPMLTTSTSAEHADGIWRGERSRIADVLVDDSDGGHFETRMVR